MPGLIKSFDSTTKRAKVQMALKRLKTDGTSISYEVQADVPIIFPSSKKYSLSFPLDPDDAVVVLFSQRGLEKFKVAYEESEPDKYGFFSQKDAIAIPGFGALETTPYDPDAINLQTTDGQNAISLSEGKIDITTTGTLTINASSVIVNAPTNITQDFSIQGALLPPDHKHTGVESGPDDTSTPIP